MADRVAVINKGEIILVEDKAELMRKLGKKRLTLHLQEPLKKIPKGLSGNGLALSEDGFELTYEYDTRAERIGVTQLLADLNAAGVRLKDLGTEQSSLEDIFVDLVRNGR